MRQLCVITLILSIIAPACVDASVNTDTTVVGYVTSYAPIVKKAAPAVVSISATQQAPNALMSNDPFFNFYFGLAPGQSQPEAATKSLGSGVIVDPTGIVITCAHVVEKSTKILVSLGDNREFEGQIIAKDKLNDLVAIRLTGVKSNDPLPALALEKEDVEVGDAILAIGNPFAVGQTVTNGIISAIARNVRGRMLIQTNAAINPGNSGGALISMNGNLIGIPNAILSKTGGSIGIGFAIPEALIRNLLASIDNGGVILRPWAGISVQQLTTQLAASLGLQTPRGVLVTALHPLSPSIAAGLIQSDVITAINGQNIASPEDFIYRIQSIPLGQPISLSIQRNNLTISFQPIAPPAVPLPDQRRIQATGGFLNDLEVANVSPAILSQYQLPVGTPEKGVIITNTGNNRMAQQIGLKEGDIIEAIDQRRIESVEDLFNTFPYLQLEGSIVIRQGTRLITVNRRP